MVTTIMTRAVVDRTGIFFEKNEPKCNLFGCISDNEKIVVGLTLLNI